LLSNVLMDNMKNIETISFDCGGTLYHETKGDYIFCQEALAELGYSLDVNKVREAWEKARNWWLSEKAKTGRIWNNHARVDMIKKIASNLGIDSPRKVAVKLSNLIVERLEIQAYSDAEPTIKVLKQKDFKVIAVSNVSSKKNLKKYLSKAGLIDYFDILIASGSVGYEKPSPEIFRIASEKCKTPLHFMLHVGDKYEEDYLGAKAAGINAVLIDRKGIYKNKECKKISKLTEILSFIP